MMAEVARAEATRVGPETGALLLEYTLKALLIAGLSELVLYRLISRLGMHLSKVAQEYAVVDYFLRGSAKLGFALLNFSALLLFVALFTFLFSKTQGTSKARPLDQVVLPLVSLLLALTLTFLIFTPVMLGSIAYSVVTVLVVWAIVVQYWIQNPSLKARAMIGCYGLGVSSWLYYQITTSTYGWLGLTYSPPLVLDIHRYGEAFMVLSTALVFAVYSGFSLRTKNRRQRRRTIFYAATWGLLFVGLLAMDGVLEVFDPAAALSLRSRPKHRVDLPNGHGVLLLFALRAVHGRVIVLGLRRCQAGFHGTPGRLRACIHVHCRLCPATIPSNAICRTGIAVDRQ